jgi:hypothetical protein
MILALLGSATATGRDWSFHWRFGFLLLQHALSTNFRLFGGFINALDLSFLFPS